MTKHTDTIDRPIILGDIVRKVTKNSGNRFCVVVGETEARVRITNEIQEFQLRRQKEQHIRDGVVGSVVDPEYILCVSWTVEEIARNTFKFIDSLMLDRGVEPHFIVIHYADEKIAQSVRDNLCK